jgi:low temperature requirement protein LtrA
VLILATAPLWIAGAISGAEDRLLWWAGAAAIDLAGTWLAHPLPGRMLRSQHVDFDANHMLERCRLFLIIALGESVLSSGTAIADASKSLLTVVTGTCALVTIVVLWKLHFVSSGRLMDRYVETTSDPILAARRTVNGLLVSVAGLIAVAVGNELVIAHPHGQTSVAPAVADRLPVGSLGTRSWPRLVGLVALTVAGGLSQLVAADAALALVAAVLVVLIVTVIRERDATSSRRLTHRQA